MASVAVSGATSAVASYAAVAASRSGVDPQAFAREREASRVAASKQLQASVKPGQAPSLARVLPAPVSVPSAVYVSVQEAARQAFGPSAALALSSVSDAPRVAVSSLGPIGSGSSTLSCSSASASSSCAAGAAASCSSEHAEGSHEDIAARLRGEGHNEIVEELTKLALPRVNKKGESIEHSYFYLRVQCLHECVEGKWSGEMIRGLPNSPGKFKFSQRALVCDRGCLNGIMLRSQSSCFIERMAVAWFYRCPKKFWLLPHHITYDDGRLNLEATLARLEPMEEGQAAPWCPRWLKQRLRRHLEEEDIDEFDMPPQAPKSTALVCEFNELYHCDDDSKYEVKRVVVAKGSSRDAVNEAISSEHADATLVEQQAAILDDANRRRFAAEQANRQSLSDQLSQELNNDDRRKKMASELHGRRAGESDDRIASRLYAAIADTQPVKVVAPEVPAPVEDGVAARVAARALTSVESAWRAISSQPDEGQVVIDDDEQQDFPEASAPAGAAPVVMGFANSINDAPAVLAGGDKLFEAGTIALAWASLYFDDDKAASKKLKFATQFMAAIAATARFAAQTVPQVYCQHHILAKQTPGQDFWVCGRNVAPRIANACQCYLKVQGNLIALVRPDASNRLWGIPPKFSAAYARARGVGNSAIASLAGLMPDHPVAKAIVGLGSAGVVAGALYKLLKSDVDAEPPVAKAPESPKVVPLKPALKAAALTADVEKRKAAGMLFNAQGFWSFAAPVEKAPDQGVTRGCIHMKDCPAKLAGLVDSSAVASCNLECGGHHCIHFTECKAPKKPQGKSRGHAKKRVTWIDYEEDGVTPKSDDPENMERFFQKNPHMRPDADHDVFADLGGESDDETEYMAAYDAAQNEGSGARYGKRRSRKNAQSATVARVPTCIHYCGLKHATGPCGVACKDRNCAHICGCSATEPPVAQKKQSEGSHKCKSCDNMCAENYLTCRACNVKGKPKCATPACKGICFRKGSSVCGKCFQLQRSAGKGGASAQKAHGKFWENYSHGPQRVSCSKLQCPQGFGFTPQFARASWEAMQVPVFDMNRHQIFWALKWGSTLIVLDHHNEDAVMINGVRVTLSEHPHCSAEQSGVEHGGFYAVPVNVVGLSPGSQCPISSQTSRGSAKLIIGPKDADGMFVGDGLYSITSFPGDCGGLVLNSPSLASDKHKLVGIHVSSDDRAKGATCCYLPMLTITSFLLR